MCQFFSFITLGDGKLIYFNTRERGLNIHNADSHSEIAAYKVKNKREQAACDRVNKYEYTEGKLIIDRINTLDDRDLVETAIKNFVETDEFQSICELAVSKNGLAIQHLTEAERTPKVCELAQKQRGK